MAKTEQKINPQFPDDESLQSWARNQLWVIKNTPVAANDTVPLPAARIGYALQRLVDLLDAVVAHNPSPVEFESRGVGKPAKNGKAIITKKDQGFGNGPAMATVAPMKKANKASSKTLDDALGRIKKPGFGKGTPAPKPKAKIVLTPVEKKTLVAIEKIMNAGVVPTYRGIAQELGVKGHGGVHETVNRLAEYGKVILVGKAGRQKIGLPQ